MAEKSLTSAHELFARRNFSHCKQNKEWTKTKRLFSGGEEVPQGLAQLDTFGLWKPYLDPVSRKMVPITGRGSTFLEIFENSNLNTN